MCSSLTNGLASYVQTEQDWLHLHEEFDQPVHIFRLGGVPHQDIKVAVERQI
jgi:hypothetical protein